MTKRLHLLSSGVGAGSAALAFPDDDVAHVCDVFTHGPVRPLSSQSTLREWLLTRFAFLESLGGEAKRNLAGAVRRDQEGEKREGVDAFCDAFERFDRYDEVVVWAADGLVEQLFACWVVVAAKAEGHDLSRLRLASPRIDQSPWHGRIFVGLCEPKNLAKGAWRPWSDFELEAACEAWDAFISPTPQRFLELVHEPRDADFLAALPALLGRYPTADIGLDDWEERLLRRLATCPEQTARTIGQVLSDGWEQTPDRIGDGPLFDRLLELSEPSNAARLLRRWGVGSSMRTTFFALTERGRAVLQGAENRIDALGLDRWIGGVHLDSATGQVWCRDGSTLQLRSFPDAPQRSARAALSPLEALEEYPTDRVHVVVGRGFRSVYSVVPGERVWMLPPLRGEQKAPITDLEEWLEQSGGARFAEELGEFPNVTPSDDRPEDLIASLSQATQICMWAAQAPGEWLLAGAVASTLRSLGRDPFDVMLRCSPDEAVPERGIGDMHPVVLEQVECEHDHEVFDDLMRVWEAFVSSSPEAMTELLQADALEPVARRVLDDILDRFPEETTGLSVGEERALSCIGGDGHWTSYKVMPFIERLSDTTLSEPLLSRTASESSYWPMNFELTDFGRRVFEGEANHVRANGIDRWVGGMHLSSAHGQVWWRRGRRVV